MTLTLLPALFGALLRHPSISTPIVDADHATASVRVDRTVQTAL